MPPVMNAFAYTLLHRDPDSRARAGLFRTPHGDIPLPAFAPVGTQATVKTVSPDELEDAGATLDPQQHLSPLSPSRR